MHKVGVGTDGPHAQIKSLEEEITETLLFEIKNWNEIKLKLIFEWNRNWNEITVQF